MADVTIMKTDDENVFTFKNGGETLHISSHWVGCAMGGLGWIWELRGPEGNPLARSAIHCTEKAEALQQGTDYVKKIRELIAKERNSQ